ncbi:putative defense protein 3 isoform X1 [Mytilus edulis]|uniref:putative defense protein 3 isoform X1 n=2 Tax=Mytilus edulis TaxID=6550 RepID=UPI0039F00233
MGYRMTVILFIIFLLVTSVSSHGLYVPGQSCVDMNPAGHLDSEGNKAYSQTISSPYKISINSTTYTANSVIEVFVYANGDHGYDFYEGMILQVRRANCDHKNKDVSVGTFKLGAGEDLLTTMSCTNLDDTVGHMAHAHIYNRTFYWKAPPVSEGPLFIRATIARRQMTFWMNVVSEFIMDPGSSITPETCTQPPTICSAAIHKMSTLLVLAMTVFIFIVYHSY